MAIPKLTKRQLMNELNREMRDDPKNNTSAYFGERLSYMRSMMKTMLESTYDIRGCINIGEPDAKSQAFTAATLAVLIGYGAGASNGMDIDIVNGTLVIRKTGWYLLNVNMSFDGDVNTTAYDVFIYVNGAITRIGSYHTIKLATEHESLSFN